MPDGYNAANGAPAISISAARRGVRSGVGLVFAAGTEVARYDSQVTTASGFTALTLLIPNFSSASNTRQGVWHWQATTGSAGDRLRMIYLNAANGFYMDTNGGYAYTAAPSFSAGDVLLLGFSKSAGGGGGAAQFWLNGSAITTNSLSFTSDTGTPAAAAPLWLGDDVEASSGRRLDGAIVFHAQWNRILSADEHRRLALNPWQMFRAAVRRAYLTNVVSGGGGSSIAVISNYHRMLRRA